jgi:hypothetical protein
MIRGWLVISISWTVLCVVRYVTWELHRAQGQIEAPAMLMVLIVAAAPWLGGWLVYWIVAGSRRGD